MFRQITRFPCRQSAHPLSSFTSPLYHNHISTQHAVKLPDFLGEYINSTEHNEVIGKLKVRKTASTTKPPATAAGTSSGTGSTGAAARATTTATTTTTTTVELTGVGADIPAEYTLEEKTTGDDMRMLAFGEVTGAAGSSSSSSSSSGSNEGYVLHGSVTKSMIFRPQGAAYNKLLRERSLKSYQRHGIEVTNDAVLHLNNMNHVVNFKPTQASVLKQQAREADKANRNLESTEEGEADLRLRIFEAFSKEEKIKQADLHAYCALSPGYTEKGVKVLLEKFAKYHSKGTYKHFWELLPEYRGQEQPPKP